MTRIKEDRYHPYSPTHQSKRRKGNGRIGSRDERYDPHSGIDSYRPDQSRMPIADKRGGIYRSGPTYRSKGQLKRSPYLANASAQKPNVSMESTNYVHHERRKNLVENNSVHTQIESTQHLSENPNTSTKHNSQHDPPEDSNTQALNKKKFLKKANAHTLHERKNNPSTRIHGLRRQLAGSDLPPNIRIEKERELASLLFDQQKEKVAKNTRQMISRYHQVRFFERKRAEKKLRRAMKDCEAWAKARIIDSTSDSESDPSRISTPKTEAEGQEWLKELKRLMQQLRDARVDLNYTIYAPLTEKYVGLFADDPGDRRAETKQERNEVEIGDMPRDDKSRFTKKKKDELQKIQEEQVQVTRPPMWFEIEKIMYPPSNSKATQHDLVSEMDLDNLKDEGEPDREVMKRLSLLREGRLTTHNHSAPRDKELMHGPLKTAEAERKKKDGVKGGQKRKRRENNNADDVVEQMPWMNKDGRIGPIDPDDESADEGEDGGVHLRTGEGSESESDGDGGFFER